MAECPAPQREWCWPTSSSVGGGPTDDKPAVTLETRSRPGQQLPQYPGQRHRRGGMASDGDLLLAAFEAGRTTVFKALGELADGSGLRSISKPDAQRLASR
jgi:hypothetical protein